MGVCWDMGLTCYQVQEFLHRVAADKFFKINLCLAMLSYFKMFLSVVLLDILLNNY